MTGILEPGYLRWDGAKFVLDPDVEIVGPPGPAGPTMPAFTEVTVNVDTPYAAALSLYSHLVIMADTTSSEVNIVLPANPFNGAVVTITDLIGIIVTGNAINVDGNGNDVEANLVLFSTLSSTHLKSYTLMYIASVSSWRIISYYNGIAHFGDP